MPYPRTGVIDHIMQNYLTVGTGMGMLAIFTAQPQEPHNVLYATSLDMESPSLHLVKEHSPCYDTAFWRAVPPRHTPVFCRQEVDHLRHTAPGRSAWELSCWVC